MAIGAGDVGAARRFAAKAGRLAPEQPLLLMLQAQAAQLSGEANGATAAFRAMADRSDTKLFGLHGLFIEAQRRNDLAAARLYAEDAARASPSLAWAGQAALEFRCHDGDWPGALEALERNRKGGLALANAALEAHEFAEARASLAPLAPTPTRRVATLMARIEAAEHGDTGLAREWMARAVHAAPDPVWTADGVIAETWMPVSPVTGRLDAFQWRVPVADLTPRGPTVEQTLPPLQLPLSPAPAPKPAAQLAPETTLSPSSRPAEHWPAHVPDAPA